jgi:hypothetical protein
MGNAMGFAEDLGQDVTGAVLAAGTRRLPVIAWDAGMGAGPDSIIVGAASSVVAGDGASLSFTEGQISTDQNQGSNPIGRGVGISAAVVGAGQIAIGGGGADQANSGSGGSVDIAAVTASQMAVEPVPVLLGAIPGYLAPRPNPAGIEVNETLNDISPQLPNGVMATAQGDMIAAGSGGFVGLASADNSALQATDIAGDLSQTATSDGGAAGKRHLSVIAWGGDAVPQMIRPSSDNSAWLGSFLDNFGQDRSQPNASIRIRVSA